MKPFFSLIVACCDVEPYVRECLDSVLSQPFANWEAIIGVEKSKDGTEEIVREYVAKDARFKMFTAQRSGSCSASRNTGLDRASGDFVIFLDGDDTLAANALGRLCAKMEKCPDADIYPCALIESRTENESERRMLDNFATDLTEGLTGPEATIHIYRKSKSPDWFMQMLVCRREFLASHQLKCIHGLRRQDWEFTPRALYLARKIVPLHEPFYLYRIRPGAVSTTANETWRYNKDFAIIFRSLLGFYASVSKAPDFDDRVACCWMAAWPTQIFLKWFHPAIVRGVSRPKRLETLQLLFADGFGDFNKLIRGASLKRRMAGWWIRAFVKRPCLRTAAELFFSAYFALSSKKR